MYGLLSSTINDSFSDFITNLKQIFTDFKWTDAVDILILAFLFYFVFKFFKNRKAGTLLVGMLLCMVLYALALLFNFTGVQFILSGIFKIGALAIIIIFQPELRDLLTTIGSGSIKGIRTLGDQNHKKIAQFQSIDNICKAVKVMAMERTGALIAISRTTELNDIINSGIVINADVSDYLIRNLFYDKAPLHDGAVVVENNRIRAAACILPLPKHIHVMNDLGTRHRAAIGLSEVSDAIIIVVSEETGTISVAKEGTLKRNFTEDSLRTYLAKELVNDKENSELIEKA